MNATVFSAAQLDPMHWLAREKALAALHGALAAQMTLAEAVGAEKAVDHLTTALWHLGVALQHTVEHGKLIPPHESPCAYLYSDPNDDDSTAPRLPVPEGDA